MIRTAQARRASRLCAVLTLALGLCAPAQAPPSPDSFPQTPPMGWNSWDSFGTTVTEADVRSNAQWMHDHLQRFGWQYITVDMEWFTTNPTASGNGKHQQHTLDQYGRFTPALNRFPSAINGQGFAPLAAYVHSLGLKFGIHILQGIPKEAMRDNTPIQGSSFHAGDAGDPDRTCAWNPDYVDARPNAAGQAYYDSIARLYAGWGVDLLKVDCIAAPRFKAEELVMLRKALDKTGRTIALSTSPGEPSIEHAEELQKSAQQWRISNDIWDLWHNEAAYPQGLGDQFARVAYWNHTRLPGHWPDADMLPLGELRPAPGWGKPRTSRLTADEQQTMLTLWAIARSPLMIGGNLPLSSPALTTLLTNPEVIEVDQHSSENTAAVQRPDAAVWTARAAATNSSTAGDHYVAVFNLKDEARTLDFTLDDLGLAPGTYHVRDLWRHSTRPDLSTLHVALPAHGSTLLRLSH